MQLSHGDVKKIAKLARIRMDDADIQVAHQELTNIFNWIERLADVDVSSVALEDLIPQEAMTEREDVVTDGGMPEKIIQNAPESAHNMFAVPKMVE